MLWFCIVPLRLRGAAVLFPSGALRAALVVAFDFSKHALSSEDVPLAERDRAPATELGVLLVAMLVVLAVRRARDRLPHGAAEPPSRRSVARPPRPCSALARRGSWSPSSGRSR